MTRAADYAVRAMVHLASRAGGSPAYARGASSRATARPRRSCPECRRSEGGRASLDELAAGVDVPPAFLSKVLQRLVKAGLLCSRRGKRGGFELSRPIASVSLLDILRALDSVPTLNACLIPDGCGRVATCGTHVVLAEAQRRVRETLAGASLDRIAELSRTRQRRAASAARSKRARLRRA